MRQARHPLEPQNQSQSNNGPVDVTAASGRIHLRFDMLPGIPFSALGRQMPSQLFPLTRQKRSASAALSRCALVTVSQSVPTYQARAYREGRTCRVSGISKSN
jgi:hypothetical protein